MRPIDADAMMLRVNGHGTNKFGILHDVDIREFINEQPTVDAVPVVHGYDTSGGMSLFRCSVCGWFCWDTYCGDTDTYNYCPNCGAKMDGKKE